MKVKIGFYDLLDALGDAQGVIHTSTKSRLDDKERELTFKLNLDQLPDYIEIEAPQQDLYYVWFVLEDEMAFLNQSKYDGTLFVKDANENDWYKTKFTEEEIEELNPDYWAFARPVREVDLWLSTLS